MFRRLAETFAGTSGTTDPHQTYLEEQQRYATTLPHLILSRTSGLPGFDQAIQSVSPLGHLQPPAVEYPNDIFRSDLSPSLASLAQQCATSSLDQLIAAKNGSAAAGCGWVYTPPPPRGTVPVVSQGALGNASGPLVGTPAHKKWFFDLQQAKQQMLMDKCSALQSCADVDDPLFAGCGYCVDTHRGIPIDSKGAPLYPTNTRGQCTQVAQTSAACPPPPPGPTPPHDGTCDPVNGQLSAACLSRQVTAGGCKPTGALALALAASTPTDYLATLRGGTNLNLYQQYASPPLNLDMFRQGQATVAAVLAQVGQLSADAKQDPSTALGASARDLCLQRGAVSGYDLCANLPDGSLPPFDMTCLQKLFLGMGGQPAGSAYPSLSNMTTYNSMANLGAVKQYWSQLSTSMRGSQGGFVDYATQRSAMIQFLGITPESTLVRAPFQRGVETFWFVAVPGNPNRVAGFLRRTIENDFLSLPTGPSGIPALGGLPYGCCLQLTDVWTQQPASMRFSITVDDGFWLAVNQPAAIDGTAMAQRTADAPGFFENLGLQGATTYTSQSCTPFSGSTPNLVKLYYEDAGGGWNAFQMKGQVCSGTSPLNPAFYSLTCEARAPFLTYEVGPLSGQWEELRNPGLFGQFMQVGGTDYHTRTDETTSVPGRKSFVRLNNQNSYLNFPSLAYQSWRTLTLCFRMQTMPIKETIIEFMMAQLYLSVNLTPLNGSTAVLSLEHNFSGSPTTVTTSYQVSLGTWYLLGVNNNRTSMDVHCTAVDGLVSNGGAVSFTTARLTHPGWPRLWSDNATVNRVPGQTAEACYIKVAGHANVLNGYYPGVHATSSFTFDVAWLHFFQQLANQDDLLREAKADWVYTQFPTKAGSYA